MCHGKMASEQAMKWHQAGSCGWKFELWQNLFWGTFWEWGCGSGILQKENDAFVHELMCQAVRDEFHIIVGFQDCFPLSSHFFD